MSSFEPAQKGLAMAGDRAGQAGSPAEGRAAAGPRSCNTEKAIVEAVLLRSHTETKEELQRERGGDLNVTKNLAELGL